MSLPTNLSTAQKIWRLLTPENRRNAFILLVMMLIGMVLETLGVGLVIPALALLTQTDLAHNYPVLQPTLQALGNPSQQNLIIGGMLGYTSSRHCFSASLLGGRHALPSMYRCNLHSVYLRSICSNLTPSTCNATQRSCCAMSLAR